MLSKISNFTLLKIASIGGVLTVTMGLLTRNKIHSNIIATDYYKDALKTLRGHKGAVYIMGEPIKEYTINISDTANNYTRELTARYEVPVKGSKERGTLYFWAQRKSIKDQWIVTRMELGLKKDPTKRLLVKDVEC